MFSLSNDYVIILTNLSANAKTITKLVEVEPCSDRFNNQYVLYMMRAVVGSANLAALRSKMMTHARGAGPLVRPPRIASLHVTFMFEIMSI